METGPPPSWPPRPAGASPRRLYREPEEKKLAGVCGGIADYLGVDVTVVRLATVVITLMTGVAVVAYVVAALVMPERPASVPRIRAESGLLPEGAGTSNALVVALVVVALLVVVGRDGWWLNGPVLGLMLVGVGVWLLLTRDRERDTFRAGLDTWSGGSTTLEDEAASPGDQSDGHDYTIVPSSTDDSAGPQGEVPPPIPPWGPTRSSPSPPPPYLQDETALGTVTSPPPAPPRRRGLSNGIMSLLLVGWGLVALLFVFDVVDFGLAEILAGALLIAGVGLIAGSWRGRVRPLIAIGIPLLLLLVVADTVKLPLDAGTGDRTVEILDRSDLDGTHELLAGELELDLSETPLTALSRSTSSGSRTGDIPTLRGDVGMGQLTVRLPETMTAELVIDVGMGNISVDGAEETSGVDVEWSDELEGGPGGGRIRLDLHVSMGEVRVLRG